MRPPTQLLNVLAIDGGSARLSVAVGSLRTVVAERSAPADRSSSTLMRLLDECLAAAALTPADLDAIIALRGPGSFTGLRVGLALAQGLHQALTVPVGTLGTLEVLAQQVEAAVPVRAVVRAGRDAWYLRSFGPGSPHRPLGPAQRLATAHLTEPETDGASVIVGFDVVEALAERDSAPDLARESAPLAPLALRSIESAEWDAQTLTSPLYLAPAPADIAAATAGARSGKKG